MSRALALLLLLSSLLTACSKPETLDISGVWIGEAATEYVTLPLRLELKQTGQTLKGMAASGGVVLDNLTGRVDAQQVTFSFSYNAGSIGGGAEFIARYAFTGTVTDDALTGDMSVSVDGAGPPLPGTFKFQKQP